MIDFERTFLERHHHFCHTAQEILGYKDDAEDVVQESWLESWEHRARVLSPGYVKRCVRNNSIDLLRRIKPELFEDLAREDENGNPHWDHIPSLIDGRTERDILTRDHVRFLLDHAGPRARMLLADYYMHESTPRELAEHYGLTVESVKVSIQRTKRKLAQRYHESND